MKLVPIRQSSETSSGIVDLGGVRLERKVPCTMPDGAVLYADHYSPASEGEARPYPTLLMRQPYGRDIASTVVYAHPAWFARQGYHVVIQDVRGRGDSEGDFYPFRNEGRDGAATIEWLRTRPESNGRIGMYGFSYQGMTQLLAAAEQPRGLQCIAPAMTAHDLYHGWFYQNGALRLASTLGWGLQMLKEDARRGDLQAASDRLEQAWRNLPSQYLATPYGEHPAITDPLLPGYVRDWMQHSEPGVYWESMDVSGTVAKIRVPALHLSGWYDTYLQGSVDGFHAMRTRAGSVHAREHQYLLAGPWIHIPWGDRIGAHALGCEAAYDTDGLLLRWFNHWLKDTNEFADEPRIRHFALSENKWYTDAAFPETRVDLYLQSSGRANSSKGDGVLAEEAPEEDPSNPQQPDIFVYDPEVPVAAPGGLSSMAGPSNQAVPEMGNNLLIYTSAPLPSAMHVFGSPEATIYASTSAIAADLVVKLVCLKPNHEAQFVCIGIARSSSLFGARYSADQVHVWKFLLEPTSCVFAAGDRIRIEVASSAYPLFDRNSGTGVPAREASPWNWCRSTQVVFHDHNRPSLVSLPVRNSAERRSK